ncbi:MAG: hypothetical protein IPN19_12695 [Elusimicrobia bacterium]|nr:hypothetical protein [Elusimicrobiota bacterium]
MNGGPNDDSETLANARLIATAPELLGVAKTFSQFLGVIGHHEKMKSGVDAVISKAEGRGE